MKLTEKNINELVEGREYVIAADYMYDDDDAWNYCVEDEMYDLYKEKGYIDDDDITVFPKGTKITYITNEYNGWPTFNLDGYEIDFGAIDENPLELD